LSARDATRGIGVPRQSETTRLKKRIDATRDVVTYVDVDVDVTIDEDSSFDD
jgi:hypothetical protein